MYNMYNALIANPMVANVSSFGQPIAYKRSMDSRNALAQMYQQPPRGNALAAAAQEPTYGADDAAMAQNMEASHNHKLEGVNPQLAAVFAEIERRGGPRFGYSEGVRSRERQAKMVKAGKSQTMNSRHLHGNAIDIYLLGDDGSADWDFEKYRHFWENYVLPVSREMGVPIEWGGNWKTLKDGVHFQIAS